MVISLLAIAVIALVLMTVAGVIAYTYIISKPDNIPPVISVDQVINATSNQTIFINATVTDDGSILTTIWDQKSGPKSNFTQVGDDLYVIPSTNGSYLFEIEAQDDKQLITSAGVLINVKGIEPPVEPKPVPPKPIPPKPIPPKPVPPAKDIKVTVTGDVEEGTAGKLVFEQIKKQNADYDFVLGDLGYEQDLSWFKSTYGTLGDKMWCVMGNHDDTNDEIEEETLEFCGNSYWIKTHATLFLMFNTEDSQKTLIDATKKVFANSTIMNGVKNIHVNGHKGCAVPPNQHHAAGDVKALCDYLESNIPKNIKAFYNSGHNHVLSESADGKYKQSGAGGRSHYTCGTNTAFPFCDNVHYGFLVYIIKPDGTTTHQWIDYNGVVIKQ